MAEHLDEYYMRIALNLASSARGQTSPNPLVGAVVVRDGRIVGQGAHLYAGGPHAEVYALRMAGDKAKDATVYVSLEPCSHFGRTPPCADALVEAGVSRVVIACKDPNPQVAGSGIKRLEQGGVEVEVGVLADEAEALNEAFFCWAMKQRPFVTWKTATTLDGYIATSSGHSRFVTSTPARQKVQQLRRDISAIAVGIQTVLADDPQLTVRGANTAIGTRTSATEEAEHDIPAERQPLRVVFDSTLRIPVTARLLKEPGKTVVYTTYAANEERAVEVQNVNPANIEVVSLPPTADGRVPLQKALNHLAANGINALLVEGGSTLVSQLLREQLIDRMIHFLAPKLLGGGLPVLQGLDAQTMDDAFLLDEVQWYQIGPDLCLEGKVVYKRLG